MWLCGTDPWPVAWNRARGSWDGLDEVGGDSRREEGGKGEDANREERLVVRKESGEEKNWVSGEMREEKSAGRQRQTEGGRRGAEELSLWSGSDF